MRVLPLMAACLMLAACGDPLAKVDKLSSVELADDSASVGALPDPASAEATKGLFSGLFGNRATTAPAQAVPAADAQPVEPALVEGSATTEPAVIAPVAEVKRSGLFGMLRRQPTAVPEATRAPPEPQAADQALVSVEPDKVTAITATSSAGVEKPRGGLFGLLAGARAKDKESQEASVQTASLAPVTTPKPDKQSLFNKPTRAHKGPDAQVVPFGTALPPGAVARVCDVPAGRLGKEVGKFPERGRGYRMFDSNPSASGARPFYVTGFDDKCARTFTAALALFGSPSMHEQLRYGLPSKVQPYSTTDQAYEGIKSKICGVSRKKACGAKIGALEKNTAFISIYDRIGSNAQWSNILLHNGWVLAADRKG